MPWSEYLVRFAPEDRAIVVAALMEKADQCGQCGLTEREFAEDPDAYVAMQVTCPWCALKDRVRSDGDTDRSIPGASVKLIARRAAERAAAAKPRRPVSRRERARGKSR